MLTVGSLFSGFGLMDLGLERAGLTIAWQVEINDYARGVLRKHWPNVPKYTDVHDIDAATVARVDVLAGGFPCTDISNAGRRAGIDGAHSGLWTEFARIIRALRPRYVLVENVPAILVRGMGRVLGDLAGSGYDAEWDCLSAAALGAPHRRNRLFIIAQPYCERPQRIFRAGATARKPGGTGELANAQSIGPELRQAAGAGLGGFASGGVAADVADAEGITERAGLRQSQAAWLWRGRPSDGGGTGDAWATEPGLGRVVNGCSHRVERLTGLGNAITPQQGEYLGRLIMAHAHMAD